MVSSKQMMQQLQDAYDEFRDKESIDIHQYSGKDADAAFDIISTDTFIAGIADKLIETTSIEQQEKMILNRTYLTGAVWHLNDGSCYSIAHLPELFDYAMKLEKLKKLCEKKIQN